MVIITGETVRELRKKVGISQKELAKLAGISQAHIAKIETGKVNPRLSTINSIMSVLKKTDVVKCKSVMKKRIVSVKPEDTVRSVINLMRSSGISQIPVIEKSMCIGSITERVLVEYIGSNIRRKKVRDVMGKPFPIISSEDNIEIAKGLLEYHPAVLASSGGKIVGIITKSDLLSVIK